MKEELRAIWHQLDKNSAQKALDERVKKSSRIRCEHAQAYSLKALAPIALASLLISTLMAYQLDRLKVLTIRLKRYTKWLMALETSNTLN
jgi:hypothetical protein